MDVRRSAPWATNNVGPCHQGVGGVACDGPVVDLVDMDAFMAALMARYGTKITAFELYNEVDYSGTPAQLAVPAEHMTVDVLTANPNALIGAQVHNLAGGTHDDVLNQSGGTFGQFWTAWKAMPGTHARLDFAAYHGYFSGVPLAILGACHSSASEFGQTQNPGGYLDCLRKDLAANGIPATTPTWDTEVSWGVNGNLISIDQKVGFVGQYFLLAWSSGVTKQLWYAWDNQGFGTLCNGNPTVQNPTCTPNAAATAYQHMYNWMVGNIMNQPCAETGTVYTCGLITPGNVQMLAVFDVSGNNNTFTVPAGYGHYRDLSGNTNTITGSTVMINYKPILLVP